MSRKTAIPACEACETRLCSIFAELSVKEVEDISHRKGGNLYKKGQNIFFEGTRPSGVFCINTGKVKIYKIDHTGKEQIIRLAKAGDVLGYRSLIGNELYSSFATSLENSLICFIPKEAFFNLLDDNPKMSLRVMQLLAQELRATENRLVDMAQKPVRERLAETLLVLMEFCGLEEDGATLGINLTREDLANIVGTATESVIRFLSEFKTNKIIGLSGRKIKILNRSALVKTANIYD